MPQKLVVLPQRPVGSGTVETFDFAIKVGKVTADYRDVVKVYVEGAQAELDKIGPALAAFDAAEVEAYAAAEKAKADAKAAAKGG